MSAADLEHTAECAERGHVCLDPERAADVLPQPPTWHRAAAEHLDDSAPWCQVLALAAERAADDESA